MKKFYSQKEGFCEQFTADSYHFLDLKNIYTN